MTHPEDHDDVSPVIASFLTHYDFALDDFQMDAIDSLDAGRSTLVCAPTGAGKTIVGEFACHAALERGGKCFYTTPIKALSNQKFRDLQDRHGAANVGLLTGDRAINGGAPVVVMTTEVLRNMIYERSSTLEGLQYVVLDEVHYLADRDRGGVWEEIIVQLSPDVALAALSATVSNAEEFGDWLDATRGGCEVVISEDRPVPLTHHYYVNDRIHDTFTTRSSGKAAKTAARQARGGVPNPELVMLSKRAAKRHRDKRGRSHAGIRLRWPSREDAVEELANRKWLPAIIFVFSRRGCEDAVDQLLRAGIRLTNKRDREEIRALADTILADIPEEDLRALGYSKFMAALEQGIAAHHAGMIPAFKETVEVCFQRGHLQVVIATETLALGINMPARTVVIERLEKYNGETHVLLTPGQYTQLTGRAGRRGIDDRGHAIVLHQRDLEFEQVAGLVGTRSFPLRSSFTPSYNMVVNLLRQHSVADSERLLGASFAQFQADRSVAGTEQKLRAYDEGIAGYARHLTSDLGDWSEYWGFRTKLSRLEKDGAKSKRRGRNARTRDAINALRPGDVLHLPWMGNRGLVAVTGIKPTSKGVPIVHLVTDSKHQAKAGPREFEKLPVVVGKVDLPAGNPRQVEFRAKLAGRLRALTPPGDGPVRSEGGPIRVEDVVDPQIAELRAALRDHPCHDDPNRAEIEKWQHRSDELAGKARRLRDDVARKTGSLVRAFHRHVSVLQRLEHLTTDGDIRPTERGITLAGIYAQIDLLMAECLLRGVFDGLDAAELAGIAAYVMYEPRGGVETDYPEIPTPGLKRTIAEVEEIAAELRKLEIEVGVPPTPTFDAGFVAPAWRWAGGASLDASLGHLEITGGDFVRNVKQIADLVGQIPHLHAVSHLHPQARKSVDKLRRGVVDA